MTTQKIGIIWLDAANNHNGSYSYVNSGYECVSSSPEDVQKINLNQLNPQTIYISNVKPHMYKRLGLDRFPNIRCSKFLGVMLSTIANELDLPDALQHKLPVFYTICQIIANRLQEDYSVDLQRSTYTILRDLHQILLPPELSEKPMLNMAPSKDLEHAIRQSMQKLQGNDTRRVREVHEICSARFPRAPYALSLLNFNYPTSNDYTESHILKDIEVGTNDEGTLPQTDEVVKQLIEMSKTKCAFIAIQQTGRWDRYATYWPFGREVKLVPPRQWASLPEVIDLLNYSTLKLGKMYVTEGGKLPFAPTIPEPSEVSFLSYANGLINEIVWMALSNSEEKDVFPTAFSTYMRAYDRIMCRLKGKEFVDGSFELCGYSTGVIRFFTDRSNHAETERLKHKILEMNMIPQFSALTVKER